ncbi:MurR/RpiR family transcriptional regulator [Enterococcus malodoratus]|uniref:MurR/RpiR family transcriptional regulator n=1 Tax=Enterococcus malodoratus TaxID=71451 RepID=UPI0039AF1809
MLFLAYQVELKSIEIDIYDFIIKNLDAVPYMRIRELADACHVSTSTIFRFCKKFECNGYADFRLRLQLYAKELHELAEPIQTIDELPFIEFLKRTHTNEFQERINSAASILKESDLVLFVGIGTSSIFASYGASLFSSLFTLALNIQDPLNTPLYNISDRLDNKVCLVALSVSGENEDIIDYINHIKLHKSGVIAITNSSNTPIAKLSDVDIPYYANTEMYKETNITSQLSVTYILEILARTVHQLKNKEN